MHVCPVPTHVGGPVVVGETSVLIGMMPAAREGDKLVCATGPDSVARGEPSVLIGNKPAARLGDPTTHGGTIVVGCPTVIIGSLAQVEALRTDKPFCEECEKARNRVLILDHRYHDDEPVQEAEYEVELHDGTILKGKLDAEGRARIEGVPAERAQVTYGPDVRSWERKDQTPNPSFAESFADGDADALIDAVMGEEPQT
nr:PAAR domain-containing protein [Nannocystis bainbridge]